MFSPPSEGGHILHEQQTQLASINHTLSVAIAVTLPMQEHIRCHCVCSFSCLIFDAAPFVPADGDSAQRKAVYKEDLEKPWLLSVTPNQK